MIAKGLIAALELVSELWKMAKPEDITAEVKAAVRNAFAVVNLDEIEVNEQRELDAAVPPKG
ncbi:MAG: hypothetical protein KC503_17475 [Myxococcales bacterium]|nr:hypothetical protein [Myxococcales bacterium]